MSYFTSILKNNNLSSHDGRPIWKYALSDQEYLNLIKVLQYSDSFNIDSRDACIYYAEWWKREFNGGKPSKESVFEKLNGNINYLISAHEFFEIAKKGAYMLGYKWVSKQYTLYFRTLLLQGGLPLKHISENQGKYQDFLLAVLDEQPEVIEDFIFKPSIINILPPSSQNDIIYECCFEIVKSILNDDKTYDDLFNSNEAIQSISGKLKIRNKELKKRSRISKPKNYWLLTKVNDEFKIYLKLGIADTYNQDSLSGILGFDAGENEYQLYINDELVCVFRKMINGSYKTDWFNNKNMDWDEDSNLPLCYVMVNSKKNEVIDFVQINPNLQEPSLWSKYSDDEWRLVKGYGTSNKQAAILFPNDWYCEELPVSVNIYNQSLLFLEFEGEATITNEEKSQTYFSEVNSLDWTIISQKPNWMLKASMPIVQKSPIIIVYDEGNQKIAENKYSIWIKKHNSLNDWEELKKLNTIPLGCIELKIEMEGITANDQFFNIGNLKVIPKNSSVSTANLEIFHKDSFEFTIDETKVLNIQINNNQYNLRVNPEYLKIPNELKARVGHTNEKKLNFSIVSPFNGMLIVDKSGEIVPEEKQLTLKNLLGLRILTKPNSNSIITLKNSLKSGVRISNDINETSYPLINLKDEIQRLFYLADAMDFDNKVCLTISDKYQTNTYNISGFSHSLNIEEQLNKRVSLNKVDEDLELYAVPLNCPAHEIHLIPLVKDQEYFYLPENSSTHQFIIISSIENGKQLMPRFINTDANYKGLEKEKRIQSYHQHLLEPGITNNIWNQILAYFNICAENHIPFSTFDQLRAISKCSQVAAKAFFFIGVNQHDQDDFIQIKIPEIEKDLGICFHWVSKEHWQSSFEEINSLYGFQYSNNIVRILSDYMLENGLSQLIKYIINEDKIEANSISHQEINGLRCNLGERVLNELPKRSPRITKEYNIPIEHHKQVGLLLQSPIAVAESINNTQKDYPIWGGDEIRSIIRRNIQYSQYLNRDFYNNTILHVLKTTNQ